MKAAFSATYSEWKVIKTRSVVQVVFEVPIEGSDTAYQVLGGMPLPGKEKWFVIAKMNAAGVGSLASREAGVSGRDATAKIVESAPASRSHSPYAREIAMACEDTDFQDFLRANFQNEWLIQNLGFPEEKAANIVRKELGVKSRADVFPGPTADKWRVLYDWFFTWLDDKQQEQQRQEHDEEIADA
jgi:hypothetical protein